MTFVTLFAAAASARAARPAGPDSFVVAARERLIREGTDRARRAGLTAPEREVYRELLREAFSHVLDEEMKPEEIASETRVSVATVESTLARARRHHLLDLTALGDRDPFGVAEAMDVPWVRDLSAADRAALRAFLAPRTPPAHLAAVVRADTTRARLASRILAHPRAWGGVTREAWVARILTRAECAALRLPASPRESAPLTLVRTRFAADSLDVAEIARLNAECAPPTRRARVRSSRTR